MMKMQPKATLQEFKQMLRTFTPRFPEVRLGSVKKFKAAIEDDTLTADEHYVLLSVLVWSDGKKADALLQFVLDHEEAKLAAHDELTLN